MNYGLRLVQQSNYVVQDKVTYIENFNGWVTGLKYFFNKVSDYLIAIIFIYLIFIFLFKNNKN